MCIFNEICGKLAEKLLDKKAHPVAEQWKAGPICGRAFVKFDLVSFFF